jgi:hypothetical protein
VLRAVHHPVIHAFAAASSGPAWRRSAAPEHEIPEYETPANAYERKVTIVLIQEPSIPELLALQRKRGQDLLSR